MISAVFSLCLIVAIGSMVAALIINIIFYSLLRRRFPDLWQNLGCPSGIGFTPSQMGPIYEFFRKRQYLRLGDSQLATLGRLLTLLKWLLVAALGIAVLGVLATRT